VTCDDEDYAASNIQPLQGKPVKLQVVQGSVTLVPSDVGKSSSAVAAAASKAKAAPGKGAGVCVCARVCVCAHVHIQVCIVKSYNCKKCCPGSLCIKHVSALQARPNVTRIHGTDE